MMNPYGMLHSAQLHDHNQLSRMLQIPVVPQQLSIPHGPTVTNNAMRVLGSLVQDPPPHMNGLSMGNPAQDHANRMAINQALLEHRHRVNNATGNSTSSGSGNENNSMQRQQNQAHHDHRLVINQPNLDHRHHKMNSGSGNNPPPDTSRQGQLQHPQPQQQQQQQGSSSTLELHPDIVLENFFEETDDRPHICQVCNACYKTRTHLKRHMCVHLKARPYSCTFPECGKGFNRKEHLNKHYDAVHRLSKFKCSFCAKEISRKDHLNRHIKNMHTFPLPPGGTRRGSGNNPSRRKKSGASRQLNPQAPLPEQKMGAVRLQMDILPHEQQQHYQHGNFPNGKTSSGGVTGLLELFTCAECSSTFVSENDLAIHSKTHKPQPYKCSECPRAYTRREKLTEHVRCFHQGQKFTCEYCGKDLSRKDHVLRHVRSVHPEVLASQFVEMAESNGIDPASVISARSANNGSSSSLLPTSTSTTSTSNNTSNNSIPSMGEMGALLKSVCHICLKVFGTSYHLARHTQSVHNQNMRPYSCAYCTKQFKRKDHLTNHMKSHCPSHRDGGSPNSGQINMTSLLNGSDSLRQHAINSLQIEMLTPDDEIKGEEGEGSNNGGVDENGTKGDPPREDSETTAELKHDPRENCEVMGMSSSGNVQVKKTKGMMAGQENNLPKDNFQQMWGRGGETLNGSEQHTTNNRS